MKKQFILKICAVLSICLFAAFLDPYADRVEDGNSRYNGNKFAEAEKSYNEAENYLPSKSDAADLAFNRGDARFRLDDYDGAIELYKAALASEKKDVQKKALFNIGNAFVKKGDKLSAADAYLSALRIDPDYENAKKNLEALYRKDTDKDKNKDQNKKDDKREQQKDRERKDKGDKGGSKGQQSRSMNGDQLKNLLNMMKDKPVRRQKKDDSNGVFGGGNDKPW
jgi:tetratricopeptide (TPR) repeat protein